MSLCTLTDPACRRVRAKQLLCARRMRRAGMLAIAGYNPPRRADVQATWKRHGWEPSGRVPVFTIEYQYRDAA